MQQVMKGAERGQEKQHSAILNFMPQTIAMILVKGHGRINTRLRKGMFYSHMACTVFSSVV